MISTAKKGPNRPTRVCLTLAEGLKGSYSDTATSLEVPVHAQWFLQLGLSHHWFTSCAQPPLSHPSATPQPPQDRRVSTSKPRPGWFGRKARPWNRSTRRPRRSAAEPQLIESDRGVIAKTPTARCSEVIGPTLLDLSNIITPFRTWVHHARDGWETYPS